MVKRRKEDKMNYINARKKVFKHLKGITVAVFILGGIFLIMGADVRLRYENNDSYFRKNINAPVGGDAYNYIINGTYLTAYSVIGMGCFIIGTLTGISSAFLYLDDMKSKGGNSDSLRIYKEHK